MIRLYKNLKNVYQVLVSSLTPPTSVILLGQPSLEPQELIENVRITANPAVKKTLENDIDLNIDVKLTG